MLCVSPVSLGLNDGIWLYKRTIAVSLPYALCPTPDGGASAFKIAIVLVFDDVVALARCLFHLFAVENGNFPASSAD